MQIESSAYRFLLGEKKFPSVHFSIMASRNSKFMSSHTGICKTKQSKTIRSTLKDSFFLRTPGSQFGADSCHITKRNMGISSVRE